MKNIITFLFLTIFSNIAFGQRNTINCKITYLPTIRYENKITQILKEQAAKIDSLVNIKSYKIVFNDEDIKELEKLYVQKNYEGKNIYKISDSLRSKIFEQKEIELNFDTINSISEKSIADILSSVIDGSPFNLTAKTRNSKFIYTDNFSGIPKLKEFRKYLIFYSIYKEIKFCENNYELVSKYFARQNLLRNLLYLLTRMESKY